MKGLYGIQTGYVGNMEVLYGIQRDYVSNLEHLQPYNQAMFRT